MTARDAIDAAVPALEAAGCSTPRFDAELLVADSLGVSRAALYSEPDMAVAPPAARLIGERVRRRIAREPVAYIIGRRGFRHLDLEVDPRVIIPRPETELLVDVALEQPEGARVHDVGTGSGAIALAILDERPDLRVSASEAYRPAAEVARENAARLDLPLEVEETPGLPQGEYDLVVANLPYIRDDEWDDLQAEIRRYEPREAFVSGADGLDAIRELIVAAAPGTLVALEHAQDQAAAIRDLLDEPESRPDLANWERITVGRVP